MRSFKLLPLASAIRGGLTLAVLCAASPAFAAPPQFDIDAGNIEDVLPEFARQAGIQIIAPAHSGKQGHIAVGELKGQMDTRQALNRLLDGTGLTVASDDGRTITLRAASGALRPISSSRASRARAAERVMLSS